MCNGAEILRECVLLHIFLYKCIWNSEGEYAKIEFNVLQEINEERGDVRLYD
jgi:hypothetical protein